MSYDIIYVYEELASL